MRRLTLLAAVATVSFASPAYAQSMGSMPGMKMPGTSMPAKEKPKPKASKPAAPKKKKPAAKPRAHAERRATAPSAHQHHDMSTMPGMAMPTPSQEQQHGTGGQSMPGMATPAPTEPQHAGQEMQAMPGMAADKTEATQGGTNLPAGDAPPPPVPTDHAADRSFPPAVMVQSRDEFRTEHGGENFHQVLFNLAEYQVRNGKDGYRWDGEAWWGGDINRLVVKSEGEGTFREGVDSAEVQALYSRAIDPYFNLQAGIRHDFRPSPTRTYATIGVEGLAPYMFDTEAALFLSNKGDLLGRLEGRYDQRITQRLILQPRVELNLSAQDVPEDRIGAGLTDAELGLRLRYEIRREFAPYLGVSYEAKTGRTADFARAAGEDPTSLSFVAGIRVWF
jgi:copper resistance protein B